MALFTAHFVTIDGKVIETVVTHEASVAETWIRNIVSMYQNQTTVVGVNCTFKSHPIKSPSEKFTTIQLCIDTRCLILGLLHMKNNDFLQPLKEFFLDPKLVFVGIDMEDVVSKLENEYGLCFNKKIDGRALARLHFPFSCRGKPGLKALAYRLVNLCSWKPKKELCLENVEAKVLDKEIVKLTCLDAYACYRIGHKLLKERF